MNRHEQRIIAMKSIYQHLLLDKDKIGREEFEALFEEKAMA